MESIFGTNQFKKSFHYPSLLSSNIRQVGDHYTSENQSLSREISEASPSFKLRTFT